MSTVISVPVSSANTADIPLHASPARRAWRRFRANRLGYVSLIIFAVLFALSLAAEVLSNDKPLVVRYQGHWYFPVFQTLAETTFGGDFPTPTDYLDPFIREQLARPGNFALYPPNHYHYTTINYFSPSPSPARPDQENWLGTDDRGRDLLARLLYGFRVIRADRGRAIDALWRALRCDPELLRQLDRHRHGALQGDLGSDAGALHADHFLVALLAELLAARGIDRRLRLARHRCVCARRIPQEPHARLCAGRPGARSERSHHHVAPHPAEQPDAGRDAGALRDGGGDRCAHQPRFPRPRRAAGHA